MAPAAFARELRAVGLPVDDEQVLTPLCSVHGVPRPLRQARRVSCRSRPSPQGRISRRRAFTSSTVATASTSTRCSSPTPTRSTFDRLEFAARAVIAGARLLTGSYVPAYAGANGPILSRGAMITAAIAKASSARPIVVGKPSRAAVREMERRLGVPATGDRRRRRRRPPRGGARPPRRLDDDPRPQRHQRLPRPLPRSGNASTGPGDRHRRGDARVAVTTVPAVGITEPGGPGGFARGRARCARAGRRRGSARGQGCRGEPDRYRAAAARRRGACRRRGCRAWTRPATVESVGAGVEQFAVGDEVMAAVTPRRPEGGAQSQLLVAPAASVVACSRRRDVSSRRRRCR